MQDNSGKDELNLPVDKGWAMMEAQLDEAMPQKRRRAFWWWLPILLLVGGVGGYAWAQISFNSAAEEEELESVNDQPELPVAAKPLEGGQSTAAIEQQKGTVNAEHEVATSSAIVDSNVPANNIDTRLAKEEEITPHVITDDSFAMPQEETLPSNPDGTTNQQAASDQAAAPEMMAEATTLETKTQENSPSDLSDPLETRSPIFITSRLANQPIATVAPLAVEEVQQLEPTTAKLAPKLRFYAEALVGETLSDPFSSVLGGLGVETTLGRKFRLNSGAQYQYNQNHLFGASDRADGFEYVDPTGGATTESAYDITLVYRRLQTERINAYTHLSYQVHPRLYLGLGVQGSYITNASARFSTEQVLANPSPNQRNEDVLVDLYDDQVAAVSFDQFTNAYTAPLDVRRWQWAGQATASYRWHKSWSLELQYLRHLSSWPAKGETFGGPHVLQAGLRYYLQH